MSSSAQLAESFSRMVQAIDRESQFLKGMATLQTEEVETKRRVYSINQLVSSLETSVNDFEVYLDKEIDALDGLEELHVKGEEVIEDIEKMKENIPQYLRNTRNADHQVISQKKHTSPLKSLQESILDEEPNNKKECEVAKVAPECYTPSLITTEELESVAKSTRSRLSLAQVTTALQTIVGLIKSKDKLLKVWTQKKRLSQKNKDSYQEYKALKCDDHQSRMFITEKELRTSKVFEAGEATGRALLHTLRSLKRIKQVRSKGENTFVLIK